MKRSIHIHICATLLLGGVLAAPGIVRAQQRVPTPRSAQFAQKWDARNFSHRLFDSLLRRHVKRGNVSYAGIRRYSLSLLREYEYRLAHTNPARLRGGKAAQLAFWINAHNALMLRSKLRRHRSLGAKKKPRQSPAKPARAKPFAFQVGRKWYTLAQIRALIVTRFQDSRALFALAGGSAHDPWLRARAYTARKLAQRLGQVARNYVSHGRRGVRLDRKKKVIWLPRLFQRHAKAFKAAPYKGVLQFVAAHLKRTEDAAFIKTHLTQLTVRYGSASKPRP